MQAVADAVAASGHAGPVEVAPIGGDLATLGLALVMAAVAWPR
jgi:hypothetical protein